MACVYLVNERTKPKATRVQQGVSGEWVGAQLGPKGFLWSPGILVPSVASVTICEQERHLSNAWKQDTSSPKGWQGAVGRNTIH